MAAPSKSFTVVADSSVNADSPWIEDIVEDFRDNDIHLDEWLGKNYTAAVDHDHDGTNSKSVSLTVPVMIIDDQTDYTSTISAYAVQGGDRYFYVASTATKTLQIRYWAHDGGAATWGAKVKIDGTTFGGEQTDSNGTYAEYTDTMDITSLTVGWHYLELWFRGTNGSGTSHIMGFQVAAT